MVARVLIAALALATTSLADAERAACTPMASPVFFPGNIGTPPATPTREQCQEVCLAKGCAAYMWATTGVCFTYQAYNAAAGFTAAPPTGLVTSVRCGTQVPLVNGDFPGNDLSNAPATDAVECNYKCEETKGCRAFSWTNYNGGTCWMKTARPDAASAPFDGSVVSGEMFTCTATVNRDIVGEDLASVQRANWRECCGVCRRTQGCAATSWTTYNGGTCWLKKTSKGLSDLQADVTALTLG